MSNLCVREGKGCDDCPYGGVKVGSKGPADAPIVIVGEGLTPIELAKKTPFIGPAGELLQKMIATTGWDPANILYINAMECYPRDKKSPDRKAKNPKTGKMQVVAEGGKKKFAKAIQSCNWRLVNEISKHPRKLIIALGAGAAQSLTGDKSLKVMNVRGQFFDHPLAEHGLFVTVNPSMMLMGVGSLQQYKQDFQKAAHRLAGVALAQYQEPEYMVLKTATGVRNFAKYLKKKKGLVIGADIETGGFNFLEDGTLCVGFAIRDDFVVIVQEDMVIPELFQNDCVFTWHNGKFDIKFLWQEGCWDAKVHEDTMLMSYALNETKGLHGLEQVGKDWLNAPDYKAMLDSYLPNKKTSYRVIPKPILHKYLAIDAALTRQLYKAMRRVVAADKHSEKAYTHVMIPASNYLARVEWNGFMVDREWALKHKEEMEKERAEHYEKFQKLALDTYGKEVNVKSPAQLKEYLYGFLGLGHPHMSTDKDTLERLPYHECLEPLLRMRKLDKYLSTYVYPCLEKVDAHGRVHASYLINGTVTGRLSSKGPNMQNIPRLPEVRGIFKAPDGRVIVECDLSQAELRSLAQLSNDVELCRIYNSDEMSLHDEVTGEIFPQYNNPDTDPLEKKELKMRGKAVNFGIVYGRQAFSFVAEFGITVQEATRWITKWLDRFPQARDFIKRCRTAVANGDTLVTVFGRKRRFGIITPERQKKLENEASNFPHQSTASDITLLAGCYIEPIIRERFGALVVNTVHDCIVVECDPEHADAIAHLITSVMVAIPKLYGLNRVPFESDAEIGDRWGHLDHFDYKPAFEGLEELELFLKVKELEKK